MNRLKFPIAAAGHRRDPGPLFDETFSPVHWRSRAAICRSFASRPVARRPADAQHWPDPQPVGPFAGTGLCPSEKEGLVLMFRIVILTSRWTPGRVAEFLPLMNEQTRRPRWTGIRLPPASMSAPTPARPGGVVSPMNSIRRQERSTATAKTATDSRSLRHSRPAGIGVAQGRSHLRGGHGQ